MTEAFDSETRAADESANAALPAALARRCLPLRPTCVAQHTLMLWDAAPRFALTLSTMISLVLLAALAVLLAQELTKRAVTTQPVSVPHELAGDGYIPGVAGHCCNTLPAHS